MVKEYLGPLNGQDAQLARQRAALTSELRATQRVEQAHAVASYAAVLAALDPFDGIADRVFRAVMHLMGYRRHRRGDWRRNRKETPMGTRRDILDAYGSKEPAPSLVKVMAENPNTRRFSTRPRRAMHRSCPLSENSSRIGPGSPCSDRWPGWRNRR